MIRSLGLTVALACLTGCGGYCDYQPADGTVFVLEPASPMPLGQLEGFDPTTMTVTWTEDEMVIRYITDDGYEATVRYAVDE